MKRAALGVALVAVAALVWALFVALGSDPEVPGAGGSEASAPPAEEETPPFIDVNDAIRKRLDGDRARREAQNAAGGAGGRAESSPESSPSSSPEEAQTDDDDSAGPGADPTLVFAADRDGIRGAVDESTEAIRDCYSSWLRTQPNLSGKLTVQFSLVSDPSDPDFAQVRNVELQDSELGHVFMEGCVASLFEDLQFEAPEGGELTVRYPLVFLAE